MTSEKIENLKNQLKEFEAINDQVRRAEIALAKFDKMVNVYKGCKIDLILGPSNNPTSSSGIRVHNIDDDFISLVKAGIQVYLQKQLNKFSEMEVQTH